MVGTTGGDTEHWLAVVSLNDALTEYYRSVYHGVRSPSDLRFAERLLPGPTAADTTARPRRVPKVDSRRQPPSRRADQRVGRG